MWIGWRTPAFESGATPAQREASRRETAALQLVHGLLFDVSSPLYQRLVVQEQSVLELGSWAGEYARDPGLLVVQAVLAPGRPFEPVLEAIEQEVARLARGEGGIEAMRCARHATPRHATHLGERWVAVP